MLSDRSRQVDESRDKRPQTRGRRTKRKGLPFDDRTAALPENARPARLLDRDLDERRRPAAHFAAAAKARVVGHHGVQDVLARLAEGRRDYALATVGFGHLAALEDF